MREWDSVRFNRPSTGKQRQLTAKPLIPQLYTVKITVRPNAFQCVIIRLDWRLNREFAYHRYHFWVMDLRGSLVCYAKIVVPRQNVTLHLNQLLVSSNLSQLYD